VPADKDIFMPSDTKGRRCYPEATALLITADSGGSNSYRARAWKAELQRFADETHLAISVSHFPPGTSKWNKIEHRLFCHITENWRARPLVDHETVVQLIGNTRTQTGLRVRARLDTHSYSIGIRIPDPVLSAVALEREDFHGEWNYTILPRPGRPPGPRARTGVARARGRAPRLLVLLVCLRRGDGPSDKTRSSFWTLRACRRASVKPETGRGAPE
jgi:hypothetical protein